MAETTIIYLSPEQAEQFILFQKYFVPISLCLERKVFEQKAADVTLRFNKEGRLVNILRGDLLYAEGANFENTN